MVLELHKDVKKLELNLQDPKQSLQGKLGRFEEIYNEVTQFVYEI